MGVIDLITAIFPDGVLGNSYPNAISLYFCLTLDVYLAYKNFIFQRNEIYFNKVKVLFDNGNFDYMKDISH